ncbi:MAG: MFS transporter [Chloroflexota bacterium]|nr:MAG: MFS transporter [Chloroflexota bacterium]
MAIRPQGPNTAVAIASRRFATLDYAWIVVAVTFVVMLAAAAVRSIPAVLMVPLESEFRWDRTVVSSGVSVNILLFGLCGPFAAAVMERIGMRQMMLFALVAMGLAAGGATLITEGWQFVLLWGVVVGLGSGAMAGWVAASVANRWFATRRGLVTGILTAANATGQLIFLPILAGLSAEMGWRVAAWTAATVVAAAVPFVIVIVRDRPADIGSRPFGAPSDWTPSARPPLGNPFVMAIQTLAHGLRNRDFLLLSGTFFICGASTSGLVGTHLITHSIEQGIPQIAAAGFLAIIGVFDVVGTMVSGWLTDRYDSRRLLMWYYGLRGLSLFFLPYAYDAGVSGLTIFAVFYGLDWVATVPPTIRLTADVFGRERVATYFAWVLAIHQIGGAAIALLAGVVRSWQGSYGLAFVASGFLCLIAAWMSTRIGERSARPAAVSAAA